MARDIGESSIESSGREAAAKNRIGNRIGKKYGLVPTPTVRGEDLSALALSTSKQGILLIYFSLVCVLEELISVFTGHIDKQINF